MKSKSHSPVCNILTESNEILKKQNRSEGNELRRLIEERKTPVRMTKAHRRDEDTCAQYPVERPVERRKEACAMVER